jgi:methylmalonyl-CoA mutase
VLPKEVIRATTEEKEYQINMLGNLHKCNEERSAEALSKVQKAAIQNQNMFVELMEASKFCSLGQLTSSLFAVGGQYRRNM